MKWGTRLTTAMTLTGVVLASPAALARNETPTVQVSPPSHLLFPDQELLQQAFRYGKEGECKPSSIEQVAGESCERPLYNGRVNVFESGDGSYDTLLVVQPSNLPGNGVDAALFQKVGDTYYLLLGDLNTGRTPGTPATTLTPGTLREVFDRTTIFLSTRLPRY